MSSSRLQSQESDLNSSINPEGELTKLISGGQLTGRASAWLMSNAKHILEWFKQPHVRKMLLASGVTFGTILLVIARLGFGSAGIGGGSLAAAFQSIVYGGLTPAGGLFASLQSMGALGTLLPVGAGIGAAAAAVAGLVVWLRARGVEEPREHEE